MSSASIHQVQSHPPIASANLATDAPSFEQASSASLEARTTSTISKAQNPITSHGLNSEHAQPFVHVGKLIETGLGLVFVEAPGIKNLFCSFTRALIHIKTTLISRRLWDFDGVGANSIPDILSERVAISMQILLMEEDEEFIEYLNHALRKSTPSYLAYLEECKQRIKTRIDAKLAGEKMKALSSADSEEIEEDSHVLQKAHDLLQLKISNVRKHGLAPTTYFDEIRNGTIQAGFPELYVLCQMYSPFVIYVYPVDAKHAQKGNPLVISERRSRETIDICLELVKDADFNYIISPSKTANFLKSVGGEYPTQKQARSPEKTASLSSSDQGQLLFTELGYLLMHKAGSEDNSLFQAAAAGFLRCKTSEVKEEEWTNINPEILKGNAVAWLQFHIKGRPNSILSKYLSTTIETVSSNYLVFLREEHSKFLSKRSLLMQQLESSIAKVKKIAEISLPFITQKILKIENDLKSMHENLNFITPDMLLEMIEERDYHGGILELYALSQLYNVSFCLHLMNSFYCISGEPVFVNIDNEKGKPLIHIARINLENGFGKSQYNLIIPFRGTNA